MARGLFRHVGIAGADGVVVIYDIVDGGHSKNYVDVNCRNSSNDGVRQDFVPRRGKI
jgi:hypothetical protein